MHDIFETITEQVGRVILGKKNRYNWPCAA